MAALDTDRKQTLRVLTLNCWGLKFFSKLRRERLTAIANRLAESEYDLIGLQEIWVESEDWTYMRTVCKEVYPYGQFFFTAAFGSGLAILSRHPIVSMDTYQYRLTGTPVYVSQGDWIAGKGCGCVTISHPSLGLVDVWNTHFTALGGQVGPESLRAHRTYESYELAQRCNASDLNSLPSSLCMSVLQHIAELRDSFADVHGTAEEVGISCDSPQNTWTKGKKLDEQALKHNGKRLDYILYRNPAAAALHLQCVQHELAFTELMDDLQVSYSDHFGVVATFHMVPGVSATRPQATEEERRVFGVCLGVLTVLVAANACASAWLRYGRSVAPSIVTSLLMVACTWFGTTALYSGVIWGEWHKRALRSAMAQVQILYDVNNK
ncbi:hypothetical protein Malapachy_3287 [Malassezia pachydermatis]|uniref:Endonuclease/exonuclease/phosphatase domain-containing protein n=1 Tax=Malassezia pachydermatis TaxID=77020 RepID=A0A0M8MP32_9BASI|nr:hypothetical protein Malapachy_3287 [Malassezia pachydermatis]KOS16386.1 hypothetical protein Malapachy_3287 [Malassezia pachydermatis]